MKKLIIVILYTIIFLLVMVVDAINNITIDYTGIEMTYIAIVLGYAGVSQWTAYAKSGQMPKGQVYNGNINKLYATMIITFIVSFASLLLAMIYNVSLPVGSCFTAFGAGAMAYVVGQSAKIKKEDEGE